jgi:hypothetical protein
MAELIWEHSTVVRTREGETFTACTLGAPQPDGTWIGWLEFIPMSPGAPRLRTERGTTQPNQKALEYWATGLEPVYIEGAFERAQLIGTG